MIDATQALTYSVALAVAAAIPGPGITALVARTVGSCVASGMAMLGGLILGDLIYLSFAVFGMAVIAHSFAGLFIAIKWFSIAYLTFLAWQFWTATHHDLNSGAVSSKRSLAGAWLSGLTLTLGNPKTIAFYLALLPLVIDLNSITFNAWLFNLVPLTIFILLLVAGAFIFGAYSVRRYLSGRAAQRHLHRGAAVAMAGAAGTMVLREL